MLEVPTPERQPAARWPLAAVPLPPVALAL
jgi:hypothetical protein